MFKKSANSGMSVKIPMIIGLLLLLAGVVGGVYLIQNRQSPTITEADISTAPMGVEVTNLNDTSFVVSWKTEKDAEGFVSYGTASDQINNVARDKRDMLSSDYQQYRTHYVQVSGLTAGTKYFFTVNSGRTAYLNENNLPYEVNTAAGAMSSGLPPISGSLQTADGGAADGAVVFVSGPGISRQSTITDVSGNWVFSLENALDPSLSKAATISPEDELTVSALGVNGNSSAAILGQQINDIPMLIEGQVFDFRSLVVVSEKGASKFTFIDDLAAQASPDRSTINIWNPQDNEALNTTRPLFIGTSAVNTEITIKIVQGQNEISGTTTSDERGNWRWNSDQALALGAHVIRASYTNDSGITFQDENRFSVLGDSASAPAFEASSGGQLAQASPSPTTMATATPTVRLSPTATISVAASPTATKTPTPTMTVKLSPTATVTVATTPTSTPSVRISPSVTVSASPATTKTPTPTTSATIAVEATNTPTPAQSLPVASTTLPTYVAGIAIGLLVGLAVLLLN